MFVIIITTSIVFSFNVSFIKAFLMIYSWILVFTHEIVNYLFFLYQWDKTTFAVLKLIDLAENLVRGRFPFIIILNITRVKNTLKNMKNLKVLSLREILPLFFSVFSVFNLKMKHEDKITQDRGIAKEKPKEDSSKNK